MANYYDALIAKWPSIVGADTPTKLANLNALTVAAPQPALLTINAIFNAISYADYAGLSQLQQAGLSNLLAVANGGMIDASAGTLVRTWFTNVFSGKPSLTALGALVAPFDSHTVLWTVANGYPATGLTATDLANAGGLT